MASSGDGARDKYRSFLDDSEQKDIQWRFGEPPNYDVVNKLFEEGKTKEWLPGSLEEMVQNLMKTWEMELFHKTRVEDFKSIHPDFTYTLNGRKPLSMVEVGELGGGYNPHLQTSLPEHLQIYKPSVETFETSHRAFTTTFPRGFAIEVTEVFRGPPDIVFKFRHWGFMEGHFKEHAPTGEIIELFGMAIFKVDENMRVKGVEFFFDRGELLGKLVKGDKLDNSSGEDAVSGCPVLKSTG